MGGMDECSDQLVMSAEGLEQENGVSTGDWLTGHASLR